MLSMLNKKRFKAKYKVMYPLPIPFKPWEDLSTILYLDYQGHNMALIPFLLWLMNFPEWHILSHVDKMYSIYEVFMKNVVGKARF